MAARKPFPQLNPFRDWVTSELQTRKRTWPTPIATPLVRMTSCNEDLQNKYRYFTLGLHGFDDQGVNLFDLTYGAQRDIVGYAYRDTDNGRQKVLIGADEISYVPPNIQSFQDLSPDDPRRLAVNQRISQAEEQQSQVVGQGAHPIAGITALNIKRSGLAAPMIADVKWQCYNQQQLEFLRNHFLVVGTYIVLEWGQQFHNRQLTKVLDFTDDGVDQELLNSVVFGRRYVIDNYSEPNEGNYDFVVGQVGNFTVEFEPNLNIYRCSTTLVSLGENVWGMDSSTTFTNQSAPPGDPSVTKINNIHDYFKEGSGYDQLLGKLSSAPDKYVRPQSPAFNSDASTAAGLSSVSPNPSDAAFISWNALTNDVLNDLEAIFDSASNDPETQGMIDKLKKDLDALLGLGGPPSDTLPQEVFDQQNELYQNEWIGNNKYLRSADPDTLIIITQTLAKIGPASEWLGAGIFGNTGGDDRGKLTEGIWLNATMVREAFLGTTTLQAAIEQILNNMNSAVADYWQLQLFYDDEISTYKIIDYKFSEDSREIPFYVFNSNKNDHHNETFDINFDSAFPPELVTQMMVISMIQTSSPQEQAALFARYPLINNTSPFMFAVNWTSLRDILKDKIRAYRAGYNINAGDGFSATQFGVGIGDNSKVNAAGRITNEQQIGSQLKSITNSLSNILKGFAPDNTLVAKAPPPRTTVLPPPSATPALKLDSLPLSSVLITSRLGARSAPVQGASTNHKGVDMRASVGTPVFAVKSGIVEVASGGIKGYGNAIYINHGNGYQSRYGHLSRIDVSVGDKVTGGQVIGASGDSGVSSAPHLHFEMRLNGTPINPEDSLKTAGPIQFKETGTSEPPSNVQEASGDTPSESNVPPITPTSTSTPTDSSQVLLTNEQETAINNYLLSVQQKFGSGILSLIAYTKSQLRNEITHDGYQKIGTKTVNGFVYPFPTKTSVDLKIQGLAGVSISDGFMVDKLPFIFSQYGVFQVTEVRDSITERGWYTNVKGYFKMLWPEGEGGQRVE